MESVKKQVPSEVLKRGYSNEEVERIYALGRFFLENGDIKRAEVVMAGLIEVAPEFAPAWLGMSYIYFQEKNLEQATQCALRALRSDPESVEATCYLITFTLTSGDFNSAGTYLGEISEKIEAGLIEDPKFIRFYKAQLARFQGRGE